MVGFFFYFVKERGMGNNSKVAKTKSNQGINPKDSVKTKLICIMALLVAVPLLVAIVISYRTSSSKAMDDALDLLNTRWYPKALERKPNLTKEAYMEQIDIVDKAEDSDIEITQEQSNIIKKR